VDRGAKLNYAPAPNSGLRFLATSEIIPMNRIMQTSIDNKKQLAGHPATEHRSPASHFVTGL
jgi:hypothetical protein